MTTTTTASPAIEAAAPSARLKRGQSALYFASFAVMGLLVAALGPSLSGFASQTGVHVSAVSILFTAQFLGLLLGTLSSGRVIDRLPVHPLMAIASGGIILMVALLPLPTTLALIVVAMFLLGLAIGWIGLGGNTALVWVHGRAVGPYLNALHFFFGLGALISPILVAQTLARTGSVSIAFWIMAAAMLPLPFLYLRTRSPSPPIAAASETGGHNRWAPVLLTSMLFFLYVGLEIGYSGWIFSYATQLGMASTITAGYLTSFFWAIFTLGRLVGIPLAARVRPRVLLLADLCGILFFFTLLTLWPQTPTVLWVATAGLGLSMASFYPALFTLAGRHMTLTGKVSSFLMAGDNLGAMIIPWLLGLRFAAQGTQMLAPTMLIITVSTFVLFFALLAVFRRQEVGVEAGPLTAGG